MKTEFNGLSIYTLFLTIIFSLSELMHEVFYMWWFVYVVAVMSRNYTRV